MNVVSYFCRKSNLRKLHSAIEEIAELDERIATWAERYDYHYIPSSVLEKIESYRARRARLLYRKRILEKDLGLNTNPPNL
jgi:hypothetical protein